MNFTVSAEMNFVILLYVHFVGSLKSFFFFFALSLFAVFSSISLPPANMMDNLDREERAIWWMYYFVIFCCNEAV